MTPKWKKVIAREGLILLLFLSVAFFIYNMSGMLADLYIKIGFSHITENETMLLGWLHDIYSRKAEIFSYLLYPFYLLGRFIMWAIRTLKEK